MKSREEDTLILRTLKQRPVALRQPEGDAHFVFKYRKDFSCRSNQKGVSSLK
jgi:hypothetical protein